MRACAARSITRLQAATICARFAPFPLLRHAEKLRRHYYFLLAHGRHAPALPHFIPPPLRPHLPPALRFHPARPAKPLAARKLYSSPPSHHLQRPPTTTSEPTQRTTCRVCDPMRPVNLIYTCKSACIGARGDSRMGRRGGGDRMCAGNWASAQGQGWAGEHGIARIDVVSLTRGGCSQSAWCQPAAWRTSCAPGGGREEVSRGGGQGVGLSICADHASSMPPPARATRCTHVLSQKHTVALQEPVTSKLHCAARNGAQCVSARPGGV